MNYTTITVGEKEVKLKLTLAAACQLEDKLNKNPLLIFAADMPRLRDVCQLVISAGATEDQIAQWMDEGHSFNDLIKLALDIFKATGLISANEEKNA